MTRWAALRRRPKWCRGSGKPVTDENPYMRTTAGVSEVLCVWCRRTLRPTVRDRLPRHLNTYLHED